MYIASFHRHVTALIAMGYSRLDHPAYKSCEEPEITGELVDGMRKAMEDRGAPFWVSHYSIHDDPPLMDGERRGRRRRRVDIEFERVGRGKRPRFQCEAKRLCEHSTEAEYCGEQGLGRFISGKYAAGACEAGMLGYVQSMGECAWARRIESRLNKGARQYRVCSAGKWERFTCSCGLPFTYRSEHNRMGRLGSIEIVHALLRFF